LLLKKKNPRTLAEAVQYAKQYEEARIGEDQMASIDPNLYPAHLLYLQMGVQVPLYQPPNYQPPPVRIQNTQPIVNKPLVPESKNSNTELLTKLVEEMADLKVQVTTTPVKKSRLTNTRTNVCCPNRQGHGHLLSKCPSPNTGNTDERSCRNFCGGNHSTSKCWNLASVKQDI